MLILSGGYPAVSILSLDSILYKLIISFTAGVVERNFEMLHDILLSSSSSSCCPSNSDKTLPIKHIS